MAYCVFDLDGTLSDPSVGIVNAYQNVMHQMLEGCNEITLNMSTLIGPPLEDILKEFFDERADISKARALFRSYYDNKGLYENTLYPNVREGLRQLASIGVENYLLTGKPRNIAVRILEHFEINSFFKKSYGAYEQNDAANKSNLLEEIIRENGLMGEVGVFVGDRHFDVKAANHHRLHFVGALYGFGNPHELEQAMDGCCFETSIKLFDYLTGYFKMHG